MISIKILLTTLNSKFIHSSLSLRYLKEYANNDDVFIKEYTINNKIDNVIMDLYKSKINIIGFSCYIWNVSMTLEIIDVLKKINDKLIIFVGGPEVDGLIDNKNIDIVVNGEGEETFKELIKFFNDEKEIWEIDGISYKENNNVIHNKKRNQINMDSLPFVYKDGLESLDNKIVYYETIRGCPFNCQYCTSSSIEGIRILSLDRVFKELQFFLDNKVIQVKFIDRTFNCNHEHAYKIWEYLIRNDNGYTNFHFEIGADLLNEEELLLLKTARSGLFQFEIGIQSTNLKTLEIIKRETNLKKLFHNVKTINSFRNIHQHLDLIAGLPYEDYKSFRKSFNDVYYYEPEQLQLGFLKILKETGLKKDYLALGIVYSSRPPYEVLYTRDLSFDDLIKLKLIEEVLEVFYNSRKFYYTFKYVIPFYETPFDFYESLGGFWENVNMIAHNKLKIYTLFLEFIKKEQIGNIDLIIDLLKYDVLINDNMKNIPNEFDFILSNIEKEKIKLFFRDEENISCYFNNLENYSSQQRIRMCNINKFNYDIIEYIKNDKIIKVDTIILFNYHERKTTSQIKVGLGASYNISKTLERY